MKSVLTIKKRSEQNPADCWSVEDLFPSDQAWEEAFAACQSLPEELKQLEGRVFKSSTGKTELAKWAEGLD